MPLPQPNCAPGAPCCGAFHFVAEHLLNVVMPGLLECLSGEGCSDREFYAYVIQGIDHDDPLCDTLTSWLVDVSPSPGSQQRPGKTLGLPLMKATYRIRLRESGYPIATDDGETIFAPDPADVHQAARHSYGHGERMLRDIVNAHGNKTLAPSSCSNVRLGAFTPLFTSGGCVGWEIGVSMDVPWNAGAMPGAELEPGSGS